MTVTNMLATCQSVGCQVLAALVESIHLYVLYVYTCMCMCMYNRSHVTMRSPASSCAATPCGLGSDCTAFAVSAALQGQTPSYFQIAHRSLLHGGGAWGGAWGSASIC